MKISTVFPQIVSAETSFLIHKLNSSIEWGNYSREETIWGNTVKEYFERLLRLLRLDWLANSSYYFIFFPSVFYGPTESVIYSSA